jgi:hypothetical protein
MCRIVQLRTTQVRPREKVDMANFNFIKMADPQVGMFSRFSAMDPEAASLLRKHGLNVKDAPKIEGVEQ